MIIPTIVDIRNRYWQVGGDDTRVYSSAVAAYVPVKDKNYQQWLGQGNKAIQILNEVELAEVLNKSYPDGLSLAAFTSPEALKIQAVKAEQADAVASIDTVKIGDGTPEDRLARIEKILARLVEDNYK